MSDCPDIGIVTPVFNDNTFVELMVSNIKSQDYPHDKITWYILDDSNKNDLSDTIKVMKSNLMGITVKYRKVNNPISSIGKKRNMLSKCVEEGVIVHMDPRCFYKSTFVSDSLNKLTANQNNIVVSPKNHHLFVHDDLSEWKMTNIDVSENFECSMVYTKKYFKSMNGFDIKMESNEGFMLLNPKRVTNTDTQLLSSIFTHPNMNMTGNTSNLFANAIPISHDIFTKSMKEIIGKCALDDPDWIAGFEQSDDEIEDIPRPDLKQEVNTQKQVIANDNDPQNPRVAILTPTRNKKQFWTLMRQNLKQQQYPHHKLTWYIIDDSDKGSDLGLHSIIDVLKEHLAPINVVFKSKKFVKPLGKKRNMLVAMTKGEEYILHMDDDDFYQPNWVRTYIDGLIKHPNKGLVGSLVLPTIFLHEQKDKLKIQLIEKSKDPSLVYTGCIGFTREYYDSVGGFTEKDKDESVEFANKGQTMVISPHAPIMRLHYHPKSKYTWSTVTQPILDETTTVSANIPDPLMELFARCAFNNENFVFADPDADLPLVGLAMPTYCRKRFYPNIINNLKRQSYPMHKVTLYIHDDSPPGKGFHDQIDELRQKIHPVKLVFISGMSQVKPLGKKRNELVNYIQEPYIANMDDDDFYHPTWLRRVITTLLDNPDKGLVGCVEMPHIFIHSEYDKWKLILNNPNAHKMVENKKKLEFIGEASMAYTREYFHSQGGYGEQMIQEGVKFIDPEKTIDISCMDILISVNLHPEQVGHVSWNTSNKNMLFDKQQVGFNMSKQQALDIARCAFDDQSFEFGDNNPFNLPPVAVVTPTRNNMAFESLMIENMKRQTYPHELINWYILDDSSDNSLRVDETRLKKQLGDINIIYKKLPKPVNPIGLKRNLLVNGVKEDIVVHMDDAHHYMKSYVNIMVTELNCDDKRKVVGSVVTPYVYVHEDVSKWKLVGMAFGNADDPLNISPTMISYYKSYFDERGGFGGTELSTTQQEVWTGQEVRKMIDPPKAFVIKALDKLMLNLSSHPESVHQHQRDGWNTQFAYKWFNNNGSEFDKLQVSDNDKQTISRAVFGDSGFDLTTESDKMYKKGPRVHFESIPSMYYINLERTKSRREFMEKQVSKYKDKLPNVSRIPAVDGKSNLHDFVKKPKETKQNNYELACTASHLLAMKTALKNGDEYALIMEDDIEIDHMMENYEKVIKDLNTLPKDFSLVQLHVSNPQVEEWLYKHDKPFVRWGNQFWSTGAYIVSKAYMEHLVNSHYKNTKIDFGNTRMHVADILLYDKSDGVYTLSYPWVVHKSDGSYIHGDTHTQLHAKSRDMILEKMRSLKVLNNIKDDIKIIVARYNEDISWLSDIQDECIIYNKGYTLNLKNEIKLPNVGRESHTYLRYIIDNYHNLPDIVLFTQANIEEHGWKHHPDTLLQMIEQAKTKGYSKPYTTYNRKYNQERQAYYWCEPEFNIDKRVLALPYKLPVDTYKDNKQVTFGEWFERYIGKFPDETYNLYMAGVFAVSKGFILSRSLKFYKDLISTCDYDINPMEGHFFERSWYYIFHVNSTSPIFKVLSNPTLLQKIRSTQIQLYTVLYKTIKLLEKHNINYSIFGGNVIGQLRKEEIILWDDDIDLVILDEDIHKLKNNAFISDCSMANMTLIYERHFAYHIINEPSLKGYTEISQDQYWSCDNEFKTPIGGNENQLDIFVYKNNPNTNMCNFCLGPWSRQNRVISYESMKETTLVPFGPMNVRMMKYPEEYIRCFVRDMYQDYVITHTHSSLFKSIFDMQLPYKIDKSEIELIKKFKFDIKRNELIL